MFISLFVGLLVCIVCCALLSLLFRPQDHDSLNLIEERIDAILPQLQCEQCGYKGCRPYARAITKENADIDLCPPGGRHVVTALGELLGRTETGANLAHPHMLSRPTTSQGDAMPSIFEFGQTVVIDESACIGCTKCLPVCPVDAIIGGPKQMHTVLASICTGCELCIPPCPVDCIEIVPPGGRAIRDGDTEPASLLSPTTNPRVREL